jgi:hypothetical protein
MGAPTPRRSRGEPIAQAIGGIVVAMYLPMFDMINAVH